MALKKHAVAINSIRVRGKEDIQPGVVFTHAGGQEAARLYALGAFREATDDEAKLYDVRVKDGEIAALTLGENESTEATSTIETSGTGTSKAPTAQAKAADLSKTKASAKADEDI